MMVETGRSLWLDELGASLPSRPAQRGDLQVDVAIVGAGFTGLWTAYYLAQLDPTLTVLVLDKHHVGFGASGRNGGWAVGELAASWQKYAKRSNKADALRLVRAVFDSVDEIGRVVSSEAIDCGFTKGGTIRLARNEAQRRRQVEEVAEEHRLGFTDAEYELLDAEAAQAIVGASKVLGGIKFGPSAAVDPARLVAGLADACEAAGVVILERTAAESVSGKVVETDCGTVRASVVVQATEGYTRDLEGQKRRLLPLYSRMIATEPLGADLLEQVGLTDRPTFSDDRHMVIYGQRTEDGRLAFGGRGVPYLFGSKIDPAGEVQAHSHELVHQALIDLFPFLADVSVTHRWGGVMGVPRNWTPSVQFDRVAGLAKAGGYVGEGVAAANLAGRTVAELITETDSERTTLPWVGIRSRSWEPEPLRWIGVRGGARVMAKADEIENRTGREARFATRVSAWLRGS